LIFEGEEEDCLRRFALLAAGVCGSLNLTMPAIFLRLLEKVRPAILADPPVSEFWRFKS
jgi:hypothetical protein